MVGGLAAELLELSESDKYGEALSAPVSTPPDRRNFGIPPARIPPNWGAALAVPESAPLCPTSLLLRRRLFEPVGASPPVTLGRPGTGGAPPTGGPEGPLLTLPICGADRSLMTSTFFNLVPFEMSPSNAP